MTKTNLVVFQSFIFLFLLLSHPAIGQNKDNHFCLRCHSMQTLGYRDAATGGGLVSLYVDSVQFKHSNHRNLKCLDCHNAGFASYPHTQQAKSEKLLCTTCHQNEEKFDSFHFTDKQEELERSIHYKKLGDKFTCFSCHDPHSFRDMRHETNVRQIVHTDNKICLNCHNSTAASSVGKLVPKIDLNTAHSWLPNPQLHWQTVRCVECHTPTGEFNSHEILPAKQAVHKCETCHSENSILLAKLYRFRTTESRQKLGYLKTMIYNTPYVTGMTRIPSIDRLSILIFILMLLGLSAHGLGRWISNKRGNR